MQGGYRFAFVEFQSVLCFINKASDEAWKVTWLAGKSPFFNYRRYMVKLLFFQCHVSFWLCVHLKYIIYVHIYSCQPTKAYTSLLDFSKEKQQN